MDNTTTKTFLKKMKLLSFKQKLNVLWWYWFNDVKWNIFIRMFEEDYLISVAYKYVKQINSTRTKKKDGKKLH